MHPVPTTSSSRATGRRGFSFTEVLFAVMVLGIGFIMVAAMFPVTIRQQQNTREETISASTARGALAYLQRNDIIERLQRSGAYWGRCRVLSASEWRPGKNKEDIEPTELWQAIAGNLILPDDPRTAFVPLFRCPQNLSSNIAQVYIWVVQSRNRPIYQMVAIDPQNNQPVAGYDMFRHVNADQYGTLEPKPVFVQTHFGATDADADTIEFVPPLGSKRERFDYREAVAEGGYIVIADVGGSKNGLDLSYMNGRIYQIGERIDTGNQGQYLFNLVPGNDLGPTDLEITEDSDNLAGARAYIMGRGLVNPLQPYDAVNNPFNGAAQDVAIYTSYIRLDAQQ